MPLLQTRLLTISKLYSLIILTTLIIKLLEAIAVIIKVEADLVDVDEAVEVIEDMVVEGGI